MKSILIAAFIAIFAFVQNTEAHGGVSNQSGDYILFLNQQPLSPLVGEQVKFNFSLKNLDFESVKDKNIQIRIIKIKDNDPSNDTVVEESGYTSDVNGSFDFDHQFNDPGYYDIEASIEQPNSEPVIIGFLIQARATKQSDYLIFWAVLICMLAYSAFIFHKNRIK